MNARIERCCRVMLMQLDYGRGKSKLHKLILGVKGC